MSGNAIVDSGRAGNFYYYGLPGVTSITWSGNSAFIGVIYAPEADLTLNGGGNNIDMVGSTITKSITMNGHFDFHFDESLLTSGPSRLAVNNWTEL
jgi:choice-of-anchor A domain-containing protein